MWHKKPRARVEGRWAPRPIIGIDLAYPYVAFARSRAGGAEISFTVADACRLPYGPSSFASALAQLSLNFVPAAAVSDMRRVVRRGGIVAAAVWDFRGGLVFQRLFWDTAAGVDPAAGEVRDRLFLSPLALPDGLPRLWHEAGFTEIESRSITIRMEYVDFADYWEPLLGGQGLVGKLCREPVARRPDANRREGAPGVSFRGSGRPALHDGDCMGGARQRPVARLMSKLVSFLTHIEGSMR